MVTYLLATCLFLGAAEEKSVTVGRIIIVGNATTTAEKIQEITKIEPGDEVTPKDLKAAEQRLVDSKLFEVDAKRGIRPTITVVDADGPGPRDILIRVKEAKPPAK